MERMEVGVCRMSTYVPISSACGRVQTSIDIFDLDLNPYGVMCCNECRTIIESREAWEDLAMSDLYDRV
jgi:hypothetical protein